MPLIAAKILEGITGGQVNAQQLPIQLALAQLALGAQRQDATTAFGRQQQLVGQERQNALQELALKLGITTATPEAIATEVRGQRAKSEAERKQDKEEERRIRKQQAAGAQHRSAIEDLAAAAQIGGIFGQTPGGQVPAEILGLLPGAQEFATATHEAAAAKPRDDLFDTSFLNQLSPEGAQAILNDERFFGAMSNADIFRVLAQANNIDPTKAGNLGDAQRILRGFIDQSLKVSMPVTPSDFTMGREDLINGAVQALNDMLNDPQFQKDFKESTGFSVQQAMPGGKIKVDATDVLGAAGGTSATGPGTNAPQDARQAFLARALEQAQADPGGPAAVAERLKALAAAMRSDPTVAQQLGAASLTPEDVEAIAAQLTGGRGIIR